MPRYVVLQHLMPPSSGRESHYDLMLERDGMLLTWAITELPQAGLRTAAKRLPDHRPAYLDYEGPVSGDRGEVRRVAAGEYRCRVVREERLLVELSGRDDLLLADLQQMEGDQWSVRFQAAE
jgi:hypothetical protein